MSSNLRVTVATRGAAIVVVILGAVLAFAQVPPCGRDDEACLLADYEAACRTRSADVAATCEAWLEEVEAHESSGELEWRLVAGAAYRNLAVMNADPTAVAELEEASRARYLSVLDDVQSGPAAARAYLGLALVSESPDERLRYLQLAVEADPSDGMNAEFLAQLQYAEGNTGDSGESMELAFENQPDGRRWHQAEQAIRRHSAAGRLEQAEDLRRRVLAESNIERIALASVLGFESSSAARAAIRTACHNSLIYLFGGDACLASIDAATAAALTHEDAQQRRMFAEAAVSGTTRVLSSNRLVADGLAVSSMYEHVFESFIATGIESPIVYLALSRRLADRERALALVERAVALDPDDGELWLRLALMQLELEREDDAIESLTQARTMLPDSRDVVIDLHMERAEAMRDAEP